MDSIDQRKVYRVTELNRRIKSLLESNIGFIWVEGEVSNLRRPTSGHLYFTLKDDSSQVQLAFFKGKQRGMTFEVKDGLQVRVHGQVTVYERSGQYQVIVDMIEEAGKGALQEAFERLKKKLEGEGLFDESRKKPIPRLPQRVGIITSPTGAAIRDILNVITRRFPNLHILLAPVKVQGSGAAESIASAIDYFNRQGSMDVLIVGRGGGSLEDLWAFNEEDVARAIARSEIPVISAVGHEIDFTISDFVADLRAPTPSAAAELVVGQKETFEENLKQYSQRLARSLHMFRLELKNRLTDVSRSYVFREPLNLVRQYGQRIESAEAGKKNALRSALRERQQRLDENSLHLRHRVELRYKSCTQELRRLESQLRALSPKAVLERGYSITFLPDGTIVRESGQVGESDVLNTRLREGIIESIVSGTRGHND